LLWGKPQTKVLGLGLEVAVMGLAKLLPAERCATGVISAAICCKLSREELVLPASSQALQANRGVLVSSAPLFERCRVEAVSQGRFALV
jgi:hypothetical protein